MNLSKSKVSAFQSKVKSFYLDNFRQMPWRTDTSGYNVLVSEVMLQQTQVPRVLVKFVEFMNRFPSIESLAKASNADVLSVWSGLGYNRRALFLRDTAKMVVEVYGGEIPNDEGSLVRLKGIGPNTAAAIRAYVFNEPVVFVETNIRTVFIHEFFSDREVVDDKEVLAVASQTLDHDNPREWYWALMDYGTHLKKTKGNLSRKSKSYAKQSKFDGSIRQVRAAIVRSLIKNSPQSKSDLLSSVEFVDHRFDTALESLVKDSSIVERKEGFSLD